MLGQWTPAAQSALPAKATAARSHCIWRPWRGGVNPRTSSCVRNGTFWADPSLEAGEPIWSKLYPACSRSWCESPGDCVGAAYLTPPSARQAWHRTVSNELMIWCETLWLRAEHRAGTVSGRGYINNPDRLSLLNIPWITKWSCSHFHAKQQQEPRTKLQYSPCINSSPSLPQSTRFSFCVSNKCAGTLCFYDYVPLFGAVKTNHVKHFRTFRMRLQCEIKCSCMWVLLE